MSNEEEVNKAWDSVTDAIIESAEQLRGKPMSTPPMPTSFKHNEGDNKPKRAKFNKQALAPEVRDQVRVYDRYGNEKKDIIEFDPETGNGKRISPVTGEIENCYEYNGYIVAEGIGHPDEEQFTEIVERVKVETQKFGTMHKAITPQDHSEGGAEVAKFRGTDRSLDSMRCVKCNSKLKFVDEVQEGGGMASAIQCTNSLCLTTWEQKI